MEIWKKIDGYENYSVSSEGRVRNDKTGRILKIRSDKDGYELVDLRKNGRKTFKVHRLVAQAFLPNPEDKECVDHINCVRDDNRMKNLRWCSHHENNSNPLTRKRNSEAKKGEKHPLFGCTGEKHPRSKAIIGINIENPSIIVEYASMGQAQKEGFDDSHICSCCNGNRRSHKGYYWCYKEEYIKFLESLK